MKAALLVMAAAKFYVGRAAFEVRAAFKAGQTALCLESATFETRTFAFIAGAAATAAFPAMTASAVPVSFTHISSSI
ncbi:hypothetical protein DMO16_18165 [Fictibacillus sp. S7]|uniref:Uncharacterized protein n=1 Tax=Fictibacillus enclensis TaxID=1017270 RepID=A0A0V8J5K1_9BACL|nr:hypothetical protein AS030_17035 [Fictibacillus enclensis]RXZ01414.1 hypothetical protein DMO16_18165 [Fictibacillus sp. S7]